MTRALCAAALALVATTSFAAESPAVAPAAWGAWGSETDFAVGGGVAIALPQIHRDVRLVAGFTYFFTNLDDYNFTIDEGNGDSVTSRADGRYWQLHADLVREFELSSSPIRPYVGLGLAYDHASATLTLTTSIDGDVEAATAKATDSDLIVDIVAGATFPGEKIKPFAELVFQASNGSQVLLRAGLRF